LTPTHPTLGLGRAPVVMIPPFTPGPGFYSSPAGHSTAQRPSSRHLQLCLSATTHAQPTPLGLVSRTSVPCLTHVCYILRYIALSSASWPRSHWATGGESPVLLLSYSHPHSGIRCPTHPPAGATGSAGSPRTLILGIRCPTSSRTLTLGIRCPKHSLSFGPLMGSPRTTFSGSCAAPKQHDATCHRSYPRPLLSEEQLLGPLTAQAHLYLQMTGWSATYSSTVSHSYSGGQSLELELRATLAG